MATDINLCNMAMAHLGDPGKIASLQTPTQTNEFHCQRFFQTAMDQFLIEYPLFASVRKVELALHDEEDVDSIFNGEWAFAYDVPSTPYYTLKVLKVLPEGAPKNRPSEDFELRTIDEAGEEDELVPVPLICTNLDSAWCDFITRVDTSVLPTDHVLAASYLLASMLAMPVVKGKSGIALRDATYQAYSLMQVKAVKNARQLQISEQFKTHAPSWMENR